VSSASVVFAAVPTLFSSDVEIDLEANRALYKHVAGLLDGLFVAGTTVDPPDAELAAAIAAEVAALLPAGCEPLARVARPVFKRSGESGAPGLNSSAIVRVPGVRPGESGAPDSGPV
jgi:hypothetical protein